MENPTRICFVDTETTGLEPGKHWPWEVAIITARVRPNDVVMTVERTDHYLLTIPKRLRQHIDPVANEIHNGPTRYPDLFDPKATGPGGQLVTQVDEIWSLLDGVFLAGNVVDFDARMLECVFDYAGKTKRPWHYHMIDVENICAGRLNLMPPWKSDLISAAMNVELPTVAHTALGDADWSMRLYAKVHGLVIQYPIFEETK